MKLFRHLFVFCLLLIVAMFSSLMAQVAPPIAGGTGIPVSISTEVTALNFGGSYYAINHTTQSLELLTWGVAKGNSLAVEGHELIGAPTVGWNGYYGGIKLQPDISGLMSKTNITSDLFNVFAQGAAGVVGLPTGNAISFIVGGGANYRFTPNLAWSTVDFRWVRVGATNGYEASTGLIYYLNPSASKSVAIRRLLARRAAMKLATANIH